MESSEKEIGKFRTFAKKRLQNHLEELDKNQAPKLSDVKNAYQEHEMMLEKELHDKIDDLAKINNEGYFKQVLLQIKNNLVSTFNDKATRAYAEIVKKAHE